MDITPTIMYEAKTDHQIHALKSLFKKLSKSITSAKIKFDYTGIWILSNQLKW